MSLTKHGGFEGRNHRVIGVKILLLNSSRRTYLCTVHEEPFSIFSFYLFTLLISLGDINMKRTCLEELLLIFIVGLCEDRVGQETVLCSKKRATKPCDN